MWSFYLFDAYGCGFFWACGWGGSATPRQTDGPVDSVLLIGRFGGWCTVDVRFNDGWFNDGWFMKD